MLYLFADSYDFSVICCDLKDHIHILVDNKDKAVPLEAQRVPGGLGSKIS
jgi:hypothetical protein